MGDQQQTPARTTCVETTGAISPVHTTRRSVILLTVLGVLACLAVIAATVLSITQAGGRDLLIGSCTLAALLSFTFLCLLIDHRGQARSCGLAGRDGLTMRDLEQQNERLARIVTDLAATVDLLRCKVDALSTAIPPNLVEQLRDAVQMSEDDRADMVLVLVGKVLDHLQQIGVIPGAKGRINGSTGMSVVGLPRSGN